MKKLLAWPAPLLQKWLLSLLLCLPFLAASIISAFSGDRTFLILSALLLLFCGIRCAELYVLLANERYRAEDGVCLAVSSIPFQHQRGRERGDIPGRIDTRQDTHRQSDRPRPQYNRQVRQQTDIRLHERQVLPPVQQTDPNERQEIGHQANPRRLHQQRLLLFRSFQAQNFVLRLPKLSLCRRQLELHLRSGPHRL